ncbi:hypothetical protein [Microcoleus sp. CAWBG58]|nr:hypothetical protein [Microcoleus sp. CAWBG58]
MSADRAIDLILSAVTIALMRNADLLSPKYALRLTCQEKCQ